MIFGIKIYMHQTFDAMTSSLKSLGEFIVEKSFDPRKTFSIEFEPFSDITSLVRFDLPRRKDALCIEVEAELLDPFGNKSINRASLYTLPQRLEEFGHAIKRVSSEGIGESRRLYPDLPARCLPVDEIDFPFSRLYGE